MENLFVGGLINENTLMKVNRGLNETTGVVLEYLQDAKVIIEKIIVVVGYEDIVPYLRLWFMILQEYGQRKGDDILALFILVIGR